MTEDEDERAHQQRVKRIAQEEYEKFCDTTFGRVDFGPIVEFQEEEPFQECDKDGFNNVVVDRPLSLRRRLNDLLEQSTEDSALAADLAAVGVESPGRPHKFFAGDWDVTISYRGQNKWYVAATNRETDDEKSFTIAGVSANDRDTAMTQAGQHLQKLSEPQLRRLTEQDERELALHVTQDLQGALGSYIARRLPRAVKDEWANANTYDEAARYISDPRWAGLVREALWFCWQQACPGYADTPERRAFIERHVGTRIPNVALLNEAWRLCQEHERLDPQLRTVQKVNEDEEELALQLDDLSDAEVASLAAQALQLRGRQIARARHGL